MRQPTQVHDKRDGGFDEAAEAATEIGANDIDELDRDYLPERLIKTLIYVIALLGLAAGIVALI